MKQITLISLITVLTVGCSTKENNQEATAENSNIQEEASLKELPINTLSSEEIAEGWELLFDGSSSDQWRGYNKESFPESGWYIKDGILAVEYSGTEEAGGAGDIITIEKFENFEFSVDFLVTTEGNSGILYRVIEEEDTPIWHNAPEFQLIDDQTYIDQGEYDMNKHLTGDNYDLHSSSVKPSNPVGEWNTARLVINNNHVEHWVNGQKTVEYELESEDWKSLVKESKFSEYPEYGMTREAHIGLQDHGHLIMFRNIKIRKL